MNVIQTIEQEIAEIMSGNRLYTTYLSQWKYLLESYLGGQEYRDASHLTRYQLESDAEYNARLLATPLDNHCKSVISVYNSFLFRECPEREFGAMENMPEVEDFLKDADFEGRSLDAFMKEVSTWSSVFGHSWIIVAKPNINAVTRADEQALGIRPYVNVLTPMVVLDWQWTRSPSGRFELQYFKYLEDINGDVHTVKEWTKETIRTTVVNIQDSIIYEDYTELNGLGKIPAIICYNARSTVRGIGIGDIGDIADAQRFIYNATSEVEQTIRLDSHPSLVKTPETNAGIGAGSLIHMPDNLDPGLKPYLLNFDGANIESIYQSIQHTITSIDKMANTGATRSTINQVLSGVAMETEFQLLNAKLSEKADNIELAEEQMWKLFAEYMGTTWDGCIEYPGSFNIRDTSREIDELVKVKSAATDPRVIALVDHELVEFLGEDADLILPEVVTLMNGETVPYDSTEPFESPEEMFNPMTGESIMVNDFQSRRNAFLNGLIEKE